jgi:F-type H+-transporting ATPase subunit delta
MLKITDIDNKQVKKYAKALLEIAMDKNLLDIVSIDMQNFAKYLDELQNQLTAKHNYSFLITLKLLKKQKQQDFILKALTVINANKLTTNFASILVVNHQVDLLISIAYNWNLLVSDLNGFTKVIITTAVPINESLEQNIKDMILSKGIKNFYTLKQVKPSILGGLILQIGAKVYDDSIKYKLNKASLELLKEIA